MIDTEFVIWAKNPKDPHSETMIHTQLMLKHYAQGIRETLLCDLEKNRRLLIRFFEMGTTMKKIPSKVVDDLFETKFANMGQVNAYFTQSKLNEYFDNLEGEDTYDLYLSGAHGPEDYLVTAQAMTQALKDDVRYQATAVIALNCMMLAIYPENLPLNLRKALLAPWKTQEDSGGSDPSDAPMELQIGWDNLQPNKEPVLCVIRNSGVTPREIKIKESKFHKAFSLWVPVGGQLAAVRVGQKITCIRGLICANEDYAACVHDGEILRYRLSDGSVLRKQLDDPDGISDLALDPGGRFHLLEGTTARVWDNMAQYSFDNIISLCASDNVWVIFRNDGQTYSNIKRMIRKDVIAVAQNGEDILLLDRSGHIHSLSQKNYTSRDFWNCMMERFLNLPENAVERLVYADRELLRTHKGELVCRQK